MTRYTFSYISAAGIGPDATDVPKTVEQIQGEELDAYQKECEAEAAEQARTPGSIFTRNEEEKP